MVTTKQKPTVDTQKMKRGESNHATIEIISSQRKIVGEEERNKRTAKQKTNNKMALVSPYISIITLM